jgi:choice-of-anchor B domain-containing protein
MKKLIFTLILGGIILNVNAQLNTTLVAQLDYEAAATDIWGYVAPDGTEYALVGLETGVSVVSLANPAEPEEVQFLPGDFSRWWDLKTWGDYAYIVADESSSDEGLQVIDLSNLPMEATKTTWTPEIGTRTLENCHNIYIDEEGVAYLAGCNVNGGGMIFVDVASTPGTPRLLGTGEPIYAHDVYTRDGLMYASEIYEDRFAIYDVSNKSEVKLLATQLTPFRFTHNTWLSDDGNVLYTTDEKANAPVAAYDISDLDDIQLLDEYRPIYTLGTGTVPHNVHVKDDYLMISHYTAGAVFVDASRPDNLVEVANYDTYPGPDGGFNGAWGLYPFLPSGNILVSDRQGGLFILKPNLQRACFLEGTVTDEASGQPLFDAEVEILSDQATLAISDLFGTYKTGQAQSGTFNVRFTRFGYEPKIAQATLQNGEVTVLDVALTPLATYSISAKAVSSLTGAGVPDARMIISNAEYVFEAGADDDGNFAIADVFEGTYDITVGAWGYFHKVVENVSLDNDRSLTISLEEGYQDDFLFDLGWRSRTDTATAGFWERGVPVASTFSSMLATPTADIPDDLGESCYVTSNRGGQAGASDVDNGTVQLVSPPMDLTNYNDPILSYHLWFFNEGGDGNPEDSLLVRITNGTDTVTVERVTQSRSAWRAASEIYLRDFIELTEEMRVIFQTADLPPNSHIVKAAVDAFAITEGMDNTTATNDVLDNALQIRAFPNPFQSDISIVYELETATAQNFLEVYNALGQLVIRQELGSTQGTVRIGESLENGMYFVRIQANGKLSPVRRIIKQR